MTITQPPRETKPRRKLVDWNLGDGRRLAPGAAPPTTPDSAPASAQEPSRPRSRLGRQAIAGWRRFGRWAGADAPLSDDGRPDQEQAVEAPLSGVDRDVASSKAASLEAASLEAASSEAASLVDAARPADGSQPAGARAGAAMTRSLAEAAGAEAAGADLSGVDGAAPGPSAVVPGAVVPGANVPGAEVAGLETIEPEAPPPPAVRLGLSGSEATDLEPTGAVVDGARVAGAVGPREVVPGLVGPGEEVAGLAVAELAVAELAVAELAGPRPPRGAAESKMGEPTLPGQIPGFGTTPLPVTPEAGATPLPVTPEAGATASPVTPEGGVTPLPVTPEAGASASPVTPEGQAPAEGAEHAETALVRSWLPLSGPPTGPVPQVDPRMRRRRAEVKRASGRRRVRMAGSVLAVATVGAALVGVAHTGLLGVRHIEVSGAHVGSVGQLLSAAGIVKGEPLIDVSPGRAAERLQEVPTVGVATVRRSWPATVRITVTRRRAVAQVPLGASLFGPVVEVDSTGRIIARLSTARAALPTLLGVGAPGAVGQWLHGSAGAGWPIGSAATLPVSAAAALADTTGAVGGALALITGFEAAVGAHPGTGSPQVRISRVEVAADATISAEVTAGPITIFFGAPTMLAAKVTALVTMLKTQTFAPGGLLDLQVPDRPTLTGTAIPSTP